MKLFVKISKLKLVPLHIGFWVLVWLFYSYFFSFNSNNKMYILWFSSILIPITIANTYFSIYYLIPKYLIPKKYGHFVIYSIYTLIGSAYLISMAMFFGYIFMSELEFKKMPPLSRSLPFILMSIYLVVTIVSAFKLLMHNYTSLDKHKTLENKFLQTQLKLKEEELKYLKMQIHPHFLFNTLNTLYGLALKKADETPEMILKLSNLLDYILYQTEKPQVALLEELNHIKDYVSLEKMRFHDTLLINVDTDSVDKNYQIAPMLLIPFVENSFKHGNAVDGKLLITIKASTKENELEFSVKNSIQFSQNKTKGIGLNNIKKRLEMLYPDQYSLKIHHTKNEFITCLKLYPHAK